MLTKATAWQKMIQGPPVCQEALYNKIVIHYHKITKSNKKTSLNQMTLDIYVTMPACAIKAFLFCILWNSLL